MPLEDDDQRRVDQAKDEVGADKSGTRLLVLNASREQRLGFWTVVCAVINRSIGTMLYSPIISGNCSLIYGNQEPEYSSPQRSYSRPLAVPELHCCSGLLVPSLACAHFWSGLSSDFQSRNLSFKTGTMMILRQKVYLCRTYQGVVERRTM